jgi:phosphocarrier protein HPr
MIITEVTLKNRLGLHARASAKFVNTAAQHQGNISIIRGSKKVNGKSIMGVMSLGATCGETLTLEIEGTDAEAMTNALINLIDNRFGEAE